MALSSLKEFFDEVMEIKREPTELEKHWGKMEEKNAVEEAKREEENKNEIDFDSLIS